jgi:phage repressor protein C with HTH and peptisase S24 domain
MIDLFAPAVPAEKVLSDQFRVHLVVGDSMSPTLRSNWDYVLLKPTGEYCGEGIYLVDLGFGCDLYRVQSVMGGNVLMKKDNPAYETKIVLHCDKFEEQVLGFVVADIKVRDERYLRAAA